MDELIQGLVAVLERGIVVEPYGDNWTTQTGAVRIRLADDDRGAADDERQPGEYRGRFPDPTRSW